RWARFRLWTTSTPPRASAASTNPESRSHGRVLCLHCESRRDQDMFCLNDGSNPELSDEVRQAAVTDFLEQYFPIVAPWERGHTGSSAEPGSAWFAAALAMQAQYPTV
ncbi:MAG: hypothetical protein R6W83_03330, partial [Cryobacterium sp.]